MHKIVAKTTLSVAIGAMVLAGCSNSRSTDPATTPTRATSSPTATATTEPSSASDAIVGDWADDAANWTVHFKDDDQTKKSQELINDLLNIILD